MNPALDNSEHIRFTVYTSEGVKYGAESVITPEMIDSMGYGQVGSESLRIILDTLDKAYDREFYWENGDVKTRQPEEVWKRIKNINTDEELEEIKQLLGVRDDS